jgi:hypothetical protein
MGIVTVHDDGATQEFNVRKWRRLFKEGRTSVLDEERSGHPSLVKEYLKEKCES